MKEINCGSCKWARQIADKNRTDIVGCVLLNGNPCDSFKPPVLSIDKVVGGNIYEGYVYFGRRVGDIADSHNFGNGVLTLGLMVDSSCLCKEWENGYE